MSAADTSRHTSPGELNPRISGRAAFARGALVGFALATPTQALLLLLLGSIGIGDPSRSLGELLRFSLVFAGLPAVVTAGGVAMTAARAATRRSSLRGAVLSYGVAGIGLLIVTALPAGGLPHRSLPWLWYGVVGGVGGAINGTLIGLWAGAR